MSEDSFREMKDLMEGSKPWHWTDDALCKGDGRFTGRYDDLSDADEMQMIKTCCSCPVMDQCIKWADDNQVAGVWAAGYWRGPRWDFEDDLPGV